MSPRRAIRAAWAALDTPARTGLIAGAIGIGAVLLADLWFDVDYKLAANIALIGVAALVNVFTLLYSFRSPWWTHRLGRIYWAKCVVLSLVLDQIVLSVWVSLEYPGRQYIRFAIYSAGAVVYVPMLVSLLREQRKEREP